MITQRILFIALLSWLPCPAFNFAGSAFPVLRSDVTSLSSSLPRSCSVNPSRRSHRQEFARTLVSKEKGTHRTDMKQVSMNRRVSKMSEMILAVGARDLAQATSIALVLKIHSVLGSFQFPVLIWAVAFLSVRNAHEGFALPMWDVTYLSEKISDKRQSSRGPVLSSFYPPLKRLREAWVWGRNQLRPLQSVAMVLVGFLGKPTDVP